MGAEPIELDELKPVALKRKALAQGDKVRYRVYKNPTEFVAVIAENALMAMKMSGVGNPHRILRDLPLAGNSLDAGHLVPHHMQPTAFIRPHKVAEAPKEFVAAREKNAEEKGFQPLHIGQISQHKKDHPSTIDVHVLLQALEEAAERARAEHEASPPPADFSMPEPQTPSEPDILSEALKLAAEETQEESSAPLVIEEAGGLTPEEIERLMSETRS